MIPNHAEYILLWLKVQKKTNEIYSPMVYVELGAVTWPGEPNLAPDAMHDEIQKNRIWILK